MADGLASTTVYSMMQDRKGYLWFCTEAGINRFEGHHFETFHVGNGLADNEHFQSFEDHKGRIWLSAYNGKLCYYEAGRFVTEKEDPTLNYAADAGKFLKYFMEDTDGHIWFSTFYGGIFRYDGKRITAAGRQYQSAANLLLFSSGGRPSTIVTNPQQPMLYDIATGKGRAVQHQGPLTGLTDVVTQLRIHNSTVFVTSAGIEYLQGDSLIMAISNDQLGSRISCACLAGADLWIGTYRNGVCCIRDYVRKGYSGVALHFLNQANVSHILADSEGGVWFSTLSEGVYYMPATQSYISNIPMTAVTSICHARSGDSWAAGTYYGDLLLFHHNRLIRRYKKPEYPDTRVKSLAWQRDGQWLVGRDFAPYRYDPHSGSTAPVPPLTSITDLYPAQSGIWIAARTAIYFLDHDQHLKALFESDTAATPISYKLVSVAGDDRQRWFTDIRQLFHIDSAGQTHAVAGPELFGANLIDLEMAHGLLWVATHGNGIFIFKDNKPLYHLTEANAGLTSNVCQKLMNDGRGRLWAATNKGITIFDAATGQYRFCLTLDDVLISNDIRDMASYGPSAYIATPSGISIINTDRIVSSAAPPMVYVQALKANDSSYAGPPEPRLPYTGGPITLTFTAVTFQSGQSVRYRYKAAGQQAPWTETNAGQIDFYDLPPGKYRFLISAKKYNSDWSRPVPYTFTILPLWYQRPWFKGLCIAAGVGIICMIYLLQIRRIRKREAEKTAYNKRIAALEGQALANQMNPHFIFNSLNTVQQFILHKEERQVLDYLSDFSVLMRQMLHYSGHSFIDLESEVDFLKRYLQLEQTRFKGKFTYRIDIAEGLLEEGLQVPPMLIQPLIENAIKHGLPGSGGHIRVGITLQADLLIVSVTDNGEGIDQVSSRNQLHPKGHASTALKVIESRIRLMSSQHNTGALIIRDKKELDPQQTGTIARLKIPLKNASNHEGHTGR